MPGENHEADTLVSFPTHFPLAYDSFRNNVQNKELGVVSLFISDAPNWTVPEEEASLQRGLERKNLEGVPENTLDPERPYQVTEVRWPVQFLRVIESCN